MTIRHLRIFIAVADCGKMRGAAEQLYISQPSVSQAIREMEEYYGVKLFERLNQRIYMTDSGRKLLSYARHIIASVAECEQEMKHDWQHPLLKIGSSVSVGTVMLEGLLTRLEQEIPSADIRVTINNTAEIEGQILSGRLDVAIVEGDVDSTDLRQFVVAEDELFMVVGRSHPFYQNASVAIDSLKGQPLISREEGSADRNQFERFLNERGIRMEKTWSCTNVQAIINSVAAGRGIGILSKLLIADELTSGDLKILKVEHIHMKRNIKLIYHKNKYLTEAMRRFMDVCREQGASKPD